MTTRSFSNKTAFAAGTETPAATPAFATVEVHRSIEAVEDEWRALLGGGVATPYQTPDFLGAWSANAGKLEGVAPLIVVARDADARPTALLPLGVKRRFGLQVASFLGGTHVNYNMPVFRAGRLGLFTPAETRRLMRLAAEKGGVDVFALANQPRSWRGQPNPLTALPDQPSPDFAYSGRLAPSIEEHLQRHTSAKTRSAQRRKLRRFEEHGPVRIFRADSEHDRARVLDAYFRQKAQRLAARGIDNVFAEPGVEAFIRAAAGLDGSRQAIDLYGFDVGGEIAATFGVIADSRRMCGMFNSITSCDLARYSPGELLLNFMVEDAIGRGLQEFDLGVGAAPYKALHCPDVDPLFDSVFGVSAAGRLAAAAIGGKRALKAWVKSSPRAYALATRLRRLRARTVETSPDAS
ncbi:GNAT family N-acetyltransferase [Methylopila henanensis]|uniref:GNAT family N-acetyltransferase n=1 Tax=Methylopila henanensis TaxID=873516 RepID=A0ABW4K5D0_9HYPH